MTVWFTRFWRKLHNVKRHVSGNYRTLEKTIYLGASLRKELQVSRENYITRSIMTVIVTRR
jgi:hypothetical protein